MTSDILHKPLWGFDWVVVFAGVKKAGWAALFFALGGWFVSIRDQAARLPYTERAALKYEQVQKLTGPNPIATVKCLKKKSDVATNVANKAVELAIGAKVAEVPDVDDIPNCPTPPAAKK